MANVAWEVEVSAYILALDCFLLDRG
jgi:hypothetical protein